MERREELINAVPVEPFIVQGKDGKESARKHKKKHCPDSEAVPKKREPKVEVKQRISYSAKRIYNSVSCPQIQMYIINENSNHSMTEEFSIFKEIDLPSKKIIFTEDITSNQTRIARVEHCLIREITLVTPYRIRSMSLSNELETHRFYRTKKAFGYSQYRIEKSNYYLFRTLKSLFTYYKKSTDKYYYMICGPTYLYFSHHKKHFLTVCSENENISKNICTSFTKFYDHSQQNLNEILSFSGKNIELFWKAYCEEVMRKEASFEIVANYPFYGSYHYLPRELYNGIETRESYAYLLKNQKFGSSKSDKIYTMKMEGYFLNDNVKRLSRALEIKEKPYEMYMYPVRQTYVFGIIMREIDKK